MNTLELQNLGLEEMNEAQMSEVDGGFLPVGVLVGIWVVQGCCAVVALGMKAANDEFRRD